MITPVLACFLLAAVNIYQVHAVGHETVKMAVEVLKECQKKHNVDGKTLHDMLTFAYEAHTKEEKCMVDCWMEGVEFVKDGKPFVAEIKRWFKVMYAESDLKKAYEIVDTCADKHQESDVCEFASDLSNCIIDHAKEVGLPGPKPLINTDFTM